MQWAAILDALNDLPDGFLRQGPNFAAFQNAITNGLHKFTNASDGAVVQAQPTQAVGKWLDVVGRARNIPRYTGEADLVYLNRITYLLNTPGGPPNAILGFLQVMGQTSATISEDFTTCSWSLGLPTTPPLSTLANITNGLGYVRPAGVPYNIGVARGGLYINTLNYLGCSRVTGAYLVGSKINTPLNLSTNTNNAINLLPTTYLTDPTLNPGL